MSVNKELRDFFVGRINKVLDKRLEEINKVVDEKRIEEMALKAYCEEAGSPDLPKRIQKLNQMEEDLKLERQKIENDAKEILHSKGIDCYYYFSLPNFMTEARKSHYNKILAKTHPNILSEREKIEEMRENLRATVLLSTSEPKLVSTLSKLLKSYGGEIDSLLSIIPAEE